LGFECWVQSLGFEGLWPILFSPERYQSRCHSHEEINFLLLRVKGVQRIESLGFGGRNLMPSLDSALPMERPGLEPSTMKQLIPLCPLLKSPFANTKNRPASLELEIQHFVPFSTQTPFSLLKSARVLRAKASDPLPASDRQKLQVQGKRLKVGFFLT